jgi:hypothetical protein
LFLTNVFFAIFSAAKQAKKVKAQQKKVAQPAGLKVNDTKAKKQNLIF